MPKIYIGGVYYIKNGGSIDTVLVKRVHQYNGKPVYEVVDVRTGKPRTLIGSRRFVGTGSVSDPLFVKEGEEGYDE